MVYNLKNKEITRNPLNKKQVLFVFFFRKGSSQGMKGWAFEKTSPATAELTL